MMNLPFLLKTAYRDAKTQWPKLLMFMASIILGISALVAINSFNDNLIKDLDRQAASITGADIVISGNRPATGDLLKVMDSIPGERSKLFELFSMSYLEDRNISQFVQIKALQGDFPYYGKILSEPQTAEQSFRNNQSVIIDQSFMVQQKIEIGDSIKLGDATFEIAGALTNNFGGVGLASGFAPTVFMSFDYLDKTKLVQPGSLIDYSYYFKTPADFDANEWRKIRREKFSNESLRITTIDSQKENLSEAFNSMNAFLNLVALISLLLGCIGVASSVFIYIKNKISSIAIFRCLGLKGNQAFFIFFFQILIIGIIGSIVGALLGTAIQLYLPVIFADFLPLEVKTVISWPSIFQGLLLGSIVTILFAIIPLLEVRRISPLRTIRASFSQKERRDPWTYVVVGLILLVLFFFLQSMTGSSYNAMIFIVGLLFSFAILWLVSTLIIKLLSRYFPRNIGFVFRQGLSNLFRPNNQTKILLISLGLGTAILSTMFIVQGLILKNVTSMDAGAQPNMVLYGIESNQIDSLAAVTESYKMPVIERVPIVTMRITGWKGKSKSEWLQDSTRTAKRWAFNRETRVTYKTKLDDSDELIAGKFVGNYEDGDSIFVSLDQNYAEDLDVGLGDEIEFNVQGAKIKTYVSSLRKIQFNNMRTRFFILFPAGVLEKAPQFQVLVTKSPDTETTGNYRNAVVQKFPNVSVIDLSSILTTLNDILKKISLVIQFMAGFSILTGLIVLISSLLLSKFQRIRESVILRTLGAKKRQIFLINLTEYFMIGSLAAFSGILISVLSSYLIVKFQLDFDYQINVFPLILVFLFIVGMTVFIGLFNSREVVNNSPLEVLRKELQ